MATLKYDDLMFNFEKFIPWKDISDLLGKGKSFR